VLCLLEVVARLPDLSEGLLHKTAHSTNLVQLMRSAARMEMALLLHQSPVCLPGLYMWVLILLTRPSASPAVPGLLLLTPQALGQAVHYPRPLVSPSLQRQTAGTALLRR
jgi:hypothetical protein